MALRITTSIVMAYLWLTGAATLLEITGMSAEMGVETQYGAASAFQNAVEALGQVTGSGISFESLIAIFIVLASAVQTFAGALTAAPRLMVAMGIPTPIAVFIHTPVALLAARIGIYVLSGREL
jgi:hydroxyethylthiazole kinase-like sugar kinase family protein